MASLKTYPHSIRIRQSCGHHLAVWEHETPVAVREWLQKQKCRDCEREAIRNPYAERVDHAPRPRSDPRRN
jgi:hypothetical protein